EWLKYTVNIDTAGDYTVTARVTSGVEGGNFHVEVDDVPLTGIVFHVPNTGGWSSPNWQTISTVSPAAATLPSGAHVIKLAMDGPSSGGIGNIESVSFSLITRPTATSTTVPPLAPYYGSPAVIPGKIQ